MISLSITSTVATFRLGPFQQTIFRCTLCGEWFEPGVPWDLYCLPCYARVQEATVDALAERELA